MACFLGYIFYHPAKGTHKIHKALLDGFCRRHNILKRYLIENFEQQAQYPTRGWAIVERWTC